MFQVTILLCLAIQFTQCESTASNLITRLINTNDSLVVKSARDITDWPIDTFGFGFFSSRMDDVRIKLNDECIGTNRRGDIYTSRRCDRWEIRAQRDGHFTIRNVDMDQYLTSNSFGDAFISSYSGQDNQFWFLATNLKSTRLFNKLSREFLDRDQGGKIVTSPFYGRFQRTDKIIVVNNSRTVLNIDTN